VSTFTNTKYSLASFNNWIARTWLRATDKAKSFNKVPSILDARCRCFNAAALMLLLLAVNGKRSLKTRKSIKSLKIPPFPLFPYSSGFLAWAA
jgi:hypothetical protein